ncbi:hypothetical protein HJG60_010605 [Phyllostomus discolor]|uniref:Uncharacterized protein n=1 Tax=Phyllostomus discolor TaxID=89673 RepID=A0A834ALJ8_9CHIR|nr:hypothetical protein HJG60_010605 [Phyllostomus discolor]
MTMSPDHTHLFAFGSSSGNHLGLQIAPPLRPLPSFHDLSLSIPNTSILDRTHQGQSCAMSTQETHDPTPRGHGTGALSPRAPQPPAQGKGKSGFSEPQPRSQGCRTMETPGEEACAEGSWLLAPSISILQTCPLKRCI